MYSGENQRMNRIIKDAAFKKTLEENLKAHRKMKAWLWFVFLWCAGLVGTLILVYGTKSLFWLGKMILSSHSIYKSSIVFC